MNVDLNKLRLKDPEKAQQVAELLGIDLAELETKKRQPKKLPKIIRPEQLTKLLSAIDTDTVKGVRQAAIIQSMLLAGLRISEVCNLTIDDVDLVSNDLFVQQGKNSTDRHIPIGANLKKYLEEWDAIRPESKWFFCSLQKGNKAIDRNIRQMVYDLADEARIYIRDGTEKAKIHPHLFRHTFATNLLNAGYNIREVQAMLGHKSITTTQVYTEVSMEDIRKKVEKTDWL